jgi:hypothetical protein
MDNFTILKRHPYLKQSARAYNHCAFYGYGKPDNPDYLNILKNDNHQNWSSAQLKGAVNQLTGALSKDLPQIFKLLELNEMTVCVVPRSKADKSYRTDQLLFKSTVCNVISGFGGFNDGTSYICRHTDTRTTHIRKPMPGYTNSGMLPYPGITIKTCNISSNIVGKDILLIDDIYTKSVNIDEDAIQALYDNGANSVTFYAVGRTAQF